MAAPEQTIIKLDLTLTLYSKSKSGSSEYLAEGRIIIQGPDDHETIYMLTTCTKIAPEEEEDGDDDEKSPGGKGKKGK